MKTKITLAPWLIVVSFYTGVLPPATTWANSKVENKFLQDNAIVEGIVRDSEGPLSGVIVQIEGTNKTTLSDVNGHYRIDAKPSDTLLFSFVGYKTLKMQVGSQKTLNVNLEIESSQMGEILINAGYYTVKDRERTGSIARVTAKDIEFQPVNNPLQALQGRMAGVNITQYSGIPGGGFDVQIRGRNNIRVIQNDKLEANKPLYIIDGVPISSATVSSPNFTTLFHLNEINPLSAINPSDIESIEILKDADATAIYGSRGANGVVLITTKKGKSGKTNFTLQSSTSFSKVATKMKMMNTEQYIQMRKEAFTNYGTTTFPSSAYDINGTWDQDKETDWQKELIGRTAISKNIALGVSGGTESTNFLINANHSEETTVYPNNKGYKRGTILTNFNHRSKDNKFNLNSSITYSTQESNLLQNDLTLYALTLPPNAPDLYNVDGTINTENGTFNNPMIPSLETYSNINKNIIINNTISYNLLKNITIKLNTGLTNTNFKEQRYTPKSLYPKEQNLSSANSTSYLAINDIYSYIIEPQISFKTSFRKQSISMIIGSTYNSRKTQSLSVAGSNFSSDHLIKNISAAKNKVFSAQNDVTYKYAAFFARINYSLDETYFINLTGRRDGSSRFGDNSKYGNFGAIGIAWLFTNEKLFDKLKWLSLGKLRGSYGITGSDNIGDYQYFDTYEINSLQYDNTNGLNPTKLFNPNYSWEKTSKLEGALELSLFDDMITSTISFYTNKSSNQLVGIYLPSTTGFDSVTGNLEAVVQNSGWEFTIGANFIKKQDFQWNTHINISFPKNKLLAFPNLEGSTYGNFYIVGKSINIEKFYKLEGIDPITKEYVFKDYDDNQLININDKKVIHDLSPKYHGGILNTITYKNITLDFLIQFNKQKGKNFNSSGIIPGVSMTNLPIEYNNRWTENNLNAPYTQATASGLNSNVNVSKFQSSDITISDASNIQLKNISISYNLNLLKDEKNNCKIYFQGQNLVTLTNFFGLNPNLPGIKTLPPLKTLAFGIQLNF